MFDEDATQASAPPGDAPPTTELGPAIATAAAQAWSDGTDTLPVADYEPDRPRWWPIGAIVSAILTVTGGAAAAILWLGHHPGRSSPEAESVAVAPAPTITPGPLNGIYRFDWHDSQAIIRMADGSVEPVTATGVDSLWFAMRSTCKDGVCTSTHVRVDADSHSQSDLTKGIYTMTLINGQWHARPEIGHTRCATRPGEETSEITYTLTPLPDGTLTGQEVHTVTTNECGVGGMVRTTPVSATRVGDVPPTVEWNE